MGRHIPKSAFRVNAKGRNRRSGVTVRRQGKGQGRYWRDKGAVKKPPNHGWYKLGFNSYEHYLKSGIWQTIRLMVLERDSNECAACGGYATQVHHRDYRVKTLCGSSLASLVSLCEPCHKRVEFDDNGNKRTLEAVNAELDALQLDRASSTA